MADSEKVQDQQQPPPSLKQKHQIQNHSDGVNGESTPDSVIQPKQTIGEWNIFKIYAKHVVSLKKSSVDLLISMQIALKYFE